MFGPGSIADGGCTTHPAAGRVVATELCCWDGLRMLKNLPNRTYVVLFCWTSLHIYNYIFIYTCICQEINRHINIYINRYTFRVTYIHKYIHTYIHTYIYIYLQTDRQTDIHPSIHPSIHPYIHTYIHTCLEWHFELVKWNVSDMQKTPTKKTRWNIYIYIWIWNNHRSQWQYKATAK